MSVSDRVAKFRSLLKERGCDAALIRNNADLRWLTGAKRVFDFESAHSAFITQDSLYLHTDSRYYNSFVERMGSDSAWQLDQDSVSLSEWLCDKITKSSCHFMALEDTLTLSLHEALSRGIYDSSCAVAVSYLHDDIKHLRAVKDEEELQLMRAAQAITDQTFTHMCEVIKPGMTEMELRIELENYMFSHGADSLAFDTIMASGPNSANPHAIPSQRRVEAGDFLVMDYGAAVGDYRSDMTRTVVVGKASAKHREIFDIVRKAHESCAELIKPGVSCAEVHNLAVKIISEAGYGSYFGHGLGHGVGIDIHELPAFGPRAKGELVVGNVVTDEPGIYLPGFGGVRLEDCGVVCESGYEPFTASTHELVEIAI